MLQKNQEKIKEITDKIVNEFQPDKIILFGSYAWGEPDENSDVDLLVISKEFNHFSGMERLIMLSRLRHGLARKTPLDIIGLTPKEFQLARKSKNIYWRSVTSDCIPGASV